MTQPTIEELVQQLEKDVIFWTLNKESAEDMTEPTHRHDTSRSALLSRIAEIEQERDDLKQASSDWRKIAEGLMTNKEEADEWHKMADEMYQAERMKFVREFESHDKFANEYPLYADFSMAYFENHLASVMTAYRALTARYSQEGKEVK